jgi:hypothetical protein
MTLPARIAIINGPQEVRRGTRAAGREAGYAPSGGQSLFSEINAMCASAISSYHSSRRVQFEHSPKSCLRIPSGKRQCPIIELECSLTSSFL